MRRTLSPVLVSLIVASACASSAVMPPPPDYPVVQGEVLRAASFAPLLPEEGVDVYPDEFIPEKYVLVGNISLRPVGQGCFVYDADKVAQFLKEKARQIGADAIVNVKVSSCAVVTTEQSGVTSVYGGLGIASSSDTAETTSVTGYTAVRAVAIRTTAPPSLPRGAELLSMLGEWRAEAVTPKGAVAGTLQVTEQVDDHFVGAWEWPTLARCVINGRILPNAEVLLAETRCEPDSISMTYRFTALDLGHLEGRPTSIFGAEAQALKLTRARPEEAATIARPTPSTIPPWPGAR